MNFKVNDIVEFKILNRMITGIITTIDRKEGKVIAACLKDNIGYKTNLSDLNIIREFNNHLNIVNKNIWDDLKTLDYICVTTNSILNKHKHLIMGAGIALQAAKIEPYLPIAFGNDLIRLDKVGKMHQLLAFNKFIAFQTKINYRNNSTEELITNSTSHLTRLANKYPDKTFGLPYPGISNGGLTKNIVYPLIKNLPSNVIVYYL